MARMNWTIAPGDRYGRLIAVKPTDATSTWVFACDCGKTLVTHLSPVRRGRTKSCGCLRVDNATALGHGSATHGRSLTPEYRAWEHMHSRCSNPKVANFKDYGGRGIRVCERWHSFECFLADMGPRPSKAHSIDRYPNNDGDYEPGNCRWATPVEQASNRRVNRIVTYEGRQMTLKEACERSGLPRSTAYARLKRGLDPSTDILARSPACSKWGAA